ncbi:hypothetical protein [Halobellus rufus]|uniref:hypothetical protein n=1 Tax=Halobellus rufus TaxID=1448860 RepID=UPI000AE0327C|nr:hypothetical protein [Halobellus rufus]
MWPLTDGDVDRPSRQILLAVFLVGIRDRNPGAVVNAILAFAGTHLPAVAERVADVECRPWQRAYVDLAMVTHAVGMLGPYDDVPWWDHLTHTLSASILGGITFVAAERRSRDPRSSVLGVIVGGGLLWEALEYAIHAVAERLGVEPILVVYSRRDTLLDLAFNLLGAALVLLFGDRLLGNLVEGGESMRSRDRE